MVPINKKTMLCGMSLLVNATTIESFDDFINSSDEPNFNSVPKLYTLVMNMKMPSMPGIMIFDK